jgi:hypothetical protein
MPLPTLSQIWFWVFTTIFAGAGAYLGSYLKKKGENIASKEDFDDLRMQTRELTAATKEIEAKIDDQVWNRQRQWEMKKEIFIAAAQTVAKADATLAQTVSAYLRRDTLRKMVDQCEEFWYALAAHGSAIMIVSKVSTIHTFTSMTQAYITTVLCLDPTKINQQIATEKFDEFRTRMARFYTSLRDELGIALDDSFVMPRSSEFSAAPAPGSQVPATDKPEHH